MKCNLEECKKIIDSIVFNDPEVKELVEMGWVEPESTLEFDYMIKGQVSLTYYFKFFGGDYISKARLLNTENDKYLFGWDSPDALVRAANKAIYEITHNCSLKYKEEYERAEYEMYSEPYKSSRYNGD